MTRLQEDRIDRLALEHGRVQVSEGFTDKRVRATVPNGGEFLIDEDGTPTLQPKGNFSVDWAWPEDIQSCDLGLLGEGVS